MAYDSWGGGGYSGETGRVSPDYNDRYKSHEFTGLSETTGIAAPPQDAQITDTAYLDAKKGTERDFIKNIGGGLLTGGPIGAVTGFIRSVFQTPDKVMKDMVARGYTQGEAQNAVNEVKQKAIAARDNGNFDFTKDDNGGDNQSAYNIVGSHFQGAAQPGGGNMGYDGTPGSQTAASYEQQSLDYLKGRDVIPRQLSEGALKGLGGVYGLEGGTGSQQDLIDRALSSPLYGALMGGQKVGENAILRNASMTGGLRSGDVQSNLYDYNTQLQNKSLLESYNQQLQGLSGLAGLPGYGTQIANQTSNVGQTLAAGQTAARQEAADKDQQDINKWLGIGSLGVDLLGTFFSDRRLKKNIKLIGDVKGHPFYEWDWNIIANKMGLEGKSQGVLADDIYMTNPECISIYKGFMMVDYGKLGIFKEAA